MLIFIEGNEGTGKTTLINELIKKIPAVVVKYPKEVKDTYELIKNLKMSNQIVIFDRSFVSDLVYRMWDHKPGQMSLSEIANICSWNILIIFCHHKNSYENSVKRGEDFITDENTHQIIEDNFFRVRNMIESFTKVKTFSYNYEYQTPDDVIDFIEETGAL
jgi:thymidylate kinase